MPVNVNKNKNHNLNIGHINIRSILPKLINIKECIKLNNFDILAVSESWLSEQTPDEVVNIDGYRLVRRDRSRGRGGGVLLYIRSSIKFSVVDDNRSEY